MNLAAIWGYIPVVVGLLVIAVVFYRGHRQKDRKMDKQVELDAAQQAVGKMLHEMNELGAGLVDRIEEANGDLQNLLGQVEAEKAELYQLLARSEQFAVDQEYPEYRQAAGGKTVSSDKYATVFELAAQGLDDVEIARRAHIGRGEVDLVLNLHKRYRQ